MSKWPMVPLGEVAEIDRRSVNPFVIDSDMPYLGLEHIERGGRIVGRSTVGAEALASSKFEFDEQHILYGKLRPNLGKVARPEFAGICSTDILPVRALKNLDRSFLLHFLRQPAVVSDAARRASGANLPRLSPQSLLQTLVPLPPLDEQCRIAAILDKADAVRRTAVRSAESTESLSTSIFWEMFNGISESAPLADLADVASGITKGRKTAEEVSEVPYLAVANVQAGHLKLNSVKSIAVTEREKERYALRFGDVVLTEGGDPDKLGRGTIWRSELPLCLHQNHIFRVRFPEGSSIIPEYFSSFLQSSAARTYFLRSSKQTTGIASINMTQLKRLPVPVANRSLQDKFLTRIAMIDGHLRRRRCIADQHDEVFASLQSRAFKGEL